MNEETNELYFDTPETKEAVEFLNSMFQAKTARFAGEDKNPNVPLQQGRAAMCVASTSALPYIEADTQEGITINAAALPGHKTDDQLYYGTNVTIFDVGTDAEKEASWLYLKYLTNTKNTAYFAVFNLIPKFVILNWLEHTGFEEPQETTIKLTKGTPYVVDLNLVSEKYCIGTEEWHTPALAAAHIYYEDEKGTHALKLGTDYTVTTEGFGKPVRLSINGSAMMHDLKIILDAFYHEEHDFDSESYSTVVTEGSCTVDKVVEHMCYKCGKTELETIPAPGHSYGDDYLQEVKDGKEVHYKKCEVCATPTEAEECSGGNATCVKKAVCEVCGHEYGSLSEHQYEMKITKEPTITENGERVYTCKTCGDSYTEIIDKLKITLGDANGDGVVDLNDTMIVLEAALGINDIEEDNFIKADVNSNGTIDLMDAVLVLKAALRIIEL